MATKNNQPNITQLKRENTRLKNSIEDIKYGCKMDIRANDEHNKYWIDYIESNCRAEISGYKHELQRYRRMQKYLENTHCTKKDTVYGGTTTQHSWTHESAKEMPPNSDDPLAELREYYRVLGETEFKVCTKCGATCAIEHHKQEY